MKSKNFIFFVIALVVLAGASYAFRMTKELASEIAQKEAAVKANPGSPDAHFDLAITYAYTNKIQEGLDELKKTADLAGDTKNYSRKLIERYYPLVKQGKADWKIRFRLAFAYYFGGYKDYAVAEFRNITLLNPENPWPLGYMAIIFAEQGKWDAAVGSMKKAIAIDPDVAAFHLGLAQGYYKLNMPGPGFAETIEAIRLRAMGY